MADSSGKSAPVHKGWKIASDKSAFLYAFAIISINNTNYRAKRS